jgi:hypothetical protein
LLTLDDFYIQIGDSTFSRVYKPAELTSLLKNKIPGSDPLIVKVDMVAVEKIYPKNLDVLQCITAAAKGKIIVTEGHLLWRPRILDPNGLRFMADGVELDWNQLLKGRGWRWLLKNPDWDWFINGPHWSHLMKENNLYLKKYGYLDFFKDNGIEYVNATDETWAGYVADPKIVKEAVESKYPPAKIEKVYGLVPEKLFRHRDSTLISLSKRKEYPSLTMKNLFGLTSDPVRAWWHGYKNKRLDNSILDMDKVYGALFNLIRLFEATRGDGPTPFTRDIGVSSSVAQLDALICQVAGFDLGKMLYISSGNNMFGTYTPELLADAKTKLGGWFPAPIEGLSPPT